MKAFDRVLTYVTGTLCGLCILFGVAGILSPDFRDHGANIAVVILGALTTMAASVLTGSYFARDLKKAPEEEAKKAKEEARDGS